MEYDVALSYASEDQPSVEHVYRALVNHGLRVFYDRDPSCMVDLLGEDLTIEFDAVFGKRTLVSVLFLSAYYMAKKWPRFELDRAHRGHLNAVLEGNKRYIIAARLDNTETPDFLRNIGGIDCRKGTYIDWANAIYAKVCKVAWISDEDKRDILFVFAQRRYLQVIATLCKWMEDRKSFRANDRAWLLYNLATAHSRQAELEKSRSPSQRLHLDAALDYITRYFAIHGDALPRDAKIDKFQVDNDLLFLRRKSRRALVRVIGQPLNEEATSEPKGCIHPSSMVLTVRGEVRAGNLVRGDQVLSMLLRGCEAAGKVTSRVAFTESKTEPGIVINGVLRCSQTQLVFERSRAWIEARGLDSSMVVMNGDGQYIAVRSVQPVASPMPVVALQTDHPSHNLIVDGLVCHNDT